MPMRVFQQSSGRAGGSTSRRDACGSSLTRFSQLRNLSSSRRLCYRPCSQNGRLEVELSGSTVDDVQAVAAAAATSTATAPGVQFDCLGLAQAMVDFSAAVEDAMLAELGVEKGSRRLIGIEERADILTRLEGREYAISAGGSLSNTLMALSRLGEAAARRGGAPPLRVAMAGLLGSDPLGGFYASQMRQAGVEVCSPPLAGANTGTVAVLTAPDASRTMLSYLGTAAEIVVDAALEAAIARSRVLVVEGYLWELPNAERTIRGAIAAAQRSGCVVAMTAGDAGVVERHHAEMWAAIHQGVDLLFTNADEAAALLRHEPEQGQQRGGGEPGAQHCAAGEQLALGLGPHCGVVVVTDGDRGSYITALGELHCVPPCWLEAAPVDTCGAGDAYAAGLLFGYLQQLDVVAMGRTAARAASAVISKHGATLSPDAAAALVQALPTPSGKGAAAAHRSPSAAALAPSTPHTA